MKNKTLTSPFTSSKLRALFEGIAEESPHDLTYLDCMVTPSYGFSLFLTAEFLYEKTNKRVSVSLSMSEGTPSGYIRAQVLHEIDGLIERRIKETDLGKEEILF